MGKCSAAGELQKQERHIKRLEKKKEELAGETRANNKALDTAYLDLRCMIDDDNVDLYAKSGKESED